MSIAEGISRGLFGVALIIVIGVFGVVALINGIDLILYRKGQIKFMDLSALAQWIVLTFFNEPPDGGGYA